MEASNTKAGGKTQAPRENPEQINVSNKRKSQFYVYLGKQLLKEDARPDATITLHALGNAVSTSV